MANYRKILEQHLGRKLKRSEIVHHIDGDDTNNSIDNLQIVTKKQHRRIHSDMKIDWQKILYKKLIEEKNKEIVEAIKGLELFFSPRQLSIIYKRLNNEELTKTEKEYYSRKIKRKLKALCNPLLHKTSQDIIIREA